MAERFGINPTDVLEWTEEMFEDVALYVRTTGANARARQLRNTG